MLYVAVFTRFSDMNGNWNGVRVSDAFGGGDLRFQQIKMEVSTGVPKT